MSLPFRVGRDKPLDLTGTGKALRRPGGGGPGGGNGGPAPAPPVPVVFPPEIYPIPGARNVYSTVNASVSNAAVATLATISFLSNEVAVVRAIRLVVNSLTTSSLITFSVVANQGAVPGYGAIPMPQAAATVFLLELTPVIRLPIGTSVVSIIATVAATDATTYVMSATLEGWAWDPSLAKAYFAGQVDMATGH